MSKLQIKHEDRYNCAPTFAYNNRSPGKGLEGAVVAVEDVVGEVGVEGVVHRSLELAEIAQELLLLADLLTFRAGGGHLGVVDETADCARVLAWNGESEMRGW